MHKIPPPAALSLITALAIAATPALARPGGWDGPGYGGSGWGRSSWDSPSSSASARPRPDRSREGRISVSRFVAEDDAAQALGHGPIVVASRTDGEDFVGPGDRAAYEAAVIDQLVHAGYDTTAPASTADAPSGQTVELRVLRSVAQAAEAPHKPVSGTAAMEVGTRGTAYGMAVKVDLTKPLPPLLATRLEARIVDRASGKVLWEGHAEVAAREGDAKWSEQAIAGKLAEALFDGFPRASDNVSRPG